MKTTRRKKAKSKNLLLYLSYRRTVLYTRPKYRKYLEGRKAVVLILDSYRECKSCHLPGNRLCFWCSAVSDYVVNGTGRRRVPSGPVIGCMRKALRWAVDALPFGSGGFLRTVSVSHHQTPLLVPFCPVVSRFSSVHLTSECD